MTPETGSIPDWEDCVKMICAHLESMNMTFVTIAFDAATKEVAWDFGWQEDSGQGQN